MRGKPNHIVPVHVAVQCTKCGARSTQKPDEPIKLSKWYPHIHSYTACDHDWKQTNTKVKLIDGQPHRKRRGKWVPIPREWFGHKLDDQTRRKRNTVSRRTRKSKKEQ